MALVSSNAILLFPEDLELHPLAGQRTQSRLCNWVHDEHCSAECAGSGPSRVACLEVLSRKL